MSETASKQQAPKFVCMLLGVVSNQQGSLFFCDT